MRKLYLLSIVAILTASVFSIMVINANAQNTECNTDFVYHIFQIRDTLSCIEAQADMKNTELDRRLELLEVNQKIISNNTDTEIFKTIEEYERSLNSTEATK